ncbi:MAG: hypothetical protein O3C34_07675 [Proteobacteria bacterium]|nr:hypothetical protein [Pseudomonadota bacterium]
MENKIAITNFSFTELCYLLHLQDKRPRNWIDVYDIDVQVDRGEIGRGRRKFPPIEVVHFGLLDGLTACGISPTMADDIFHNALRHANASASELKYLTFEELYKVLKNLAVEIIPDADNSSAGVEYYTKSILRKKKPKAEPPTIITFRFAPLIKLIIDRWV